MADTEPKPTAEHVQPLIRMHSCEPVTLTTTEYERLRHEVLARVYADDVGIMEVICHRLLQENAPRYHEAKRIEAEREKING